MTNFPKANATIAYMRVNHAKTIFSIIALVDLEISELVIIVSVHCN